ncbi:MAG TPA: VOC family protein [Bryobacteraceae bacterium]|nr:VOC family protein [Bryobacteraceae bacterium]
MSLSLILVSLLGLTSATAESHSPVLVNTCLITNDVARLARFYELVLRITPKTSGSDYAEFHTGVGVLAIFSAAAQEKYIPGSAEPARNRSAVLEFKVDDVDAEYARLKNVVKLWIKPPTNQPWGTRSIYFRDPDGNLIDFWAPLPAK